MVAKPAVIQIAGRSATPRLRSRRNATPTESAPTIAGMTPIASSSFHGRTPMIATTGM